MFFFSSSSSSSFFFVVVVVVLEGEGGVGDEDGGWDVEKGAVSYSIFLDLIFVVVVGAGGCCCCCFCCCLFIYFGCGLSSEGMFLAVVFRVQ